MKALTAALAACLFFTAGQTVEASDLQFALSALQSTKQTYSHRTPVRQQVVNTESAKPAAPQLLLGAYLEDIEGGLQVKSTLPGSPASQVLKPGDVLRRVSVLGQPTRKLDTLHQFEYAKQEIGPNRQAALEIVRPGQGTDYVWVTFRTAGQLANFKHDSQANARTMFSQLNDNYVSR